MNTKKEMLAYWAIIFLGTIAMEIAFFSGNHFFYHPIIVGISIGLATIIVAILFLLVQWI